MPQILIFVTLFLLSFAAGAQGNLVKVVDQKAVIIVDKTSRKVKCSDEEKTSAGTVAGGAALGAAALYPLYKFFSQCWKSSNSFKL